MSTFDPNNLDIDFDNLDKQVEHDSVAQKKSTPKKLDPLERVEVKKETQKNSLSSNEQLPHGGSQEKQVPLNEGDVGGTKTGGAKKQDSMLAEILESDDTSNSVAPKEEKQDEVTQTIYDINITKIDDLMARLVSNNYDFVTLEPQENYVEVIFRKDKQIVETKNIRFSAYTNLLIKIKTLAKIALDDDESASEGKAELKFRKYWYKIGVKTVPDVLGDKVFFKAVEVSKKASAAKNNKTSMGTILKFMGIVAFLFLILGGAFITFIVLNANTVEDVNFFLSLGINPNDINAFIQQIITILFAILVFLETIFVVIYGFKFFLTKKTQKRKRIASAILTILFLLITFTTASVWLFIDKKIKELPNWGDQARGEIQIYDTDILSSEQYDNEEFALLTPVELKSLIGPIDLRFDVDVLADKEARNGFTIEKYIWDFGDDSTTTTGVIETLDPEVLYSFDKKQTYDITLTLEGRDAVGKPLTKVVENMPPVEVGYLIDIDETILDSGGKMLRFDATSLKARGTLEWYFGNDFETPVSKGYIFRPGKPIFEETVIGLYIKNATKKDKTFDRVFVIKGESDDNIDGEIIAQADIDNSMLYEFYVGDISSDFGNGFVESFTWKIDGKEFTREGSIEQNESASKVPYEFKNYGEHDIAVTLMDSAGKAKILTTTINIEKQLFLEQPLQIFDAGSEITDINYDVKNGEYSLDGLPIPTELSFSARKVKTKDSLYSLQSVSWDFNNDGDPDDTGTYVDYEIPVSGNYTVVVNYVFVHRKRETTINTTEKIYIQAIKKDAILKLDIEKPTQYVPVTVRFDASKSSVLGQDIVKFEYDYGDGISEQRDAINEGHIYREPGDYDVKLTVTTSTGEKHSITKKLILTEKPDIVKITPSLYDAPIGQEIDFSSTQSSGQITGYFWDFGDGNVSTEANPSHSYSSPGSKTVKLVLDFTNNNTKSDEINITVLP